MIKRSLLVISFLAALSGAYFFFQKEVRKSISHSERPIHNTAPETPVPQQTIPYQRDEEKMLIDGKKVVGLPPGQEKKLIKKIRVLNRPSPEWEENLMSVLKLQGGSKVKNIELKKADSFVWAHDGIALFVESVVVTLRNQKDEQSSFRILVDAQNGKILESWDRPVFDTLKPSEENFLHVDPRYQN